MDSDRVPLHPTRRSALEFQVRILPPLSGRTTRPRVKLGELYTYAHEDSLSVW